MVGCIKLVIGLMIKSGDVVKPVDWQSLITLEQLELRLQLFIIQRHLRDIEFLLLDYTNKSH